MLNIIKNELRTLLMRCAMDDRNDHLPNSAILCRRYEGIEKLSAQSNTLAQLAEIYEDMGQAKHTYDEFFGRATVESSLLSVSDEFDIGAEIFEPMDGVYYTAVATEATANSKWSTTILMRHTTPDILDYDHFYHASSAGRLGAIEQVMADHNVQFVTVSIVDDEWQGATIDFDSLALVEPVPVQSLGFTKV